MSLTTRCPACATVFRVVPDQLKVSEGWVRCGRCSELFDARATLSPQVPVVSEVADDSAQEATREGGASPPLAPVHEESAPPPLPDPDKPGLAEGRPDAWAPLAPTPQDAAPPAWTEAPLAVPGPEPETAAGDMPQAADASSAPPPLPQEQAAPTVAAEPAAIASAIDQVSFMRRARRQAFWRRPAVRWVSGVMTLLLALALGAQVAYEARDELAQRVPALKPLLTALCQPLQCRVGPPQRIEAITIDASNFARLQPDAFRLQFTLANAASLPVALPALELTLTDNQDQAVIRRVLQPTDLGADTPQTLPAQGEWAGAITLTVSPAAAAAISGYRLLAFYP